MNRNEKVTEKKRRGGERERNQTVSFKQNEREKTMNIHQIDSYTP